MEVHKQHCMGTPRRRTLLSFYYTIVYPVWRTLIMLRNHCPPTQTEVGLDIPMMSCPMLEEMAVLYGPMFCFTDRGLGCLIPLTCGSLSCLSPSQALGGLRSAAPCLCFQVQRQTSNLQFPFPGTVLDWERLPRAGSQTQGELVRNHHLSLPGLPPPVS